MSPGGHPAKEPGQDDRGSVAGGLPQGHPDAPKPKKRLRRAYAALFRHYRSLKKEQNAIKAQHNESVEDIFNGLGRLDDRVKRMERLLAEARDRPEVVVLADVAQELHQIAAGAARHEADVESFADLL